VCSVVGVQRAIPSIPELGYVSLCPSLVRYKVVPC
jgi:hypothetical protein